MAPRVNGHAPVGLSDRERGARPEPRGVELDSLEAVIQGRAPVRRWRRLIEEANLSTFSGTGRKGEPVYSGFFYALPSEHGGALFVYGELRPGLEDSAVGELKLSWERRPEGPTPQRITSCHRAVGGWPGVSQRIAAGWPDGEQVNVAATATFLIDTTVHRPRRALRMKPAAFNVRDHAFTQIASAWSLDPPSGPVDLLSLTVVGENELAAVASGHHTLTLGLNMAVELESAMWGGVQEFIEAL